MSVFCGFFFWLLLFLKLRETWEWLNAGFSLAICYIKKQNKTNKQNHYPKTEWFKTTILFCSRILWIQKLRRAGLGGLALTPMVPAVGSGVGGSVHFQDGDVIHRWVPGCSLELLSLPGPPYVHRAPHRMAVSG